jgi:hypothetical protein
MLYVRQLSQWHPLLYTHEGERGACPGQHVHSVLLLQRSDEGPYKGQIHAAFCTCVDGYVSSPVNRLLTASTHSISGVCSHVRAMILTIRKTWDVTHEEYETARLAGLGKDDKRCTWEVPRKKAVHRFLRITGLTLMPLTSTLW